MPERNSLDLVAQIAYNRATEDPDKTMKDMANFNHYLHPDKPRTFKEYMAQLCSSYETADLPGLKKILEKMAGRPVHFIELAIAVGRASLLRTSPLFAAGRTVEGMDRAFRRMTDLEMDKLIEVIGHYSYDSSKERDDVVRYAHDMALAMIIADLAFMK